MKRILWILSLAASCAFAQTQPQPLLVANQYNITAASQVQDNRSQTARYCDYNSFEVVSSSGSYSVQMEYSDVSSSGPWTLFGGASVVTNSSIPSIGYGFGYHSWIRFNTTVGTTAVNYSCSKNYYLPSGIPAPNFTGLVYATLGQFQAATVPNVFSLFSNCAGVDYPGFDGSCHPPTGGSLNQITGLQAIASGTSLTVGSTCTTLLPCTVSVGTAVYTFTAQASAILVSGTGTAYVYVDKLGGMTVGYSGGASVTCSSGCTAVGSITSFPITSFPIATIAAVSGAWTTTVDQRASFNNDHSSHPVSVTEYGACGDGTCNDTSAIAVACSIAVANGAPLYFPQGIYLTDPIQCITVAGMIVEGAGPNQSILKSRTGGHVIEMTGTIPTLHAVTLRDFGIDGNGGAGNGIYIHDLPNSSFEITVRNVIIRNLTGRCIYAPYNSPAWNFSDVIDGNQCSTTGSSGIELAGGPNTLLENNYVHSVGPNSAAYWVYDGVATLLNNTALDTPGTGANATWARFGTNTADGDALNLYAQGTVMGSNVEDFTGYGIQVRNGIVSFQDDLFLAYPGTLTEAIHYDNNYTGAFSVSTIGSGVTFTSLSTCQGTTPGTCSVPTGGNGWAGGYAIHGGTQCPSVINYSPNATSATSQTCYVDSLSTPYPIPTHFKANPAFGVTADGLTYSYATNFWAEHSYSAGGKPSLNTSFAFGTGCTTGNPCSAVAGHDKAGSVTIGGTTPGAQGQVIWAVPYTTNNVVCSVHNQKGVTPNEYSTVNIATASAGSSVVTQTGGAPFNTGWSTAMPTLIFIGNVGYNNQIISTVTNSTTLTITPGFASPATGATFIMPSRDISMNYFATTTYLNIYSTYVFVPGDQINWQCDGF